MDIRLVRQALVAGLVFTQDWLVELVMAENPMSA